MSDDLFGVVGATLGIDQQVTPHTSAAITAATISIFDSAGTAVVEDAAMTVAAGTGEDGNGFEEGSYGLTYAFDATGQEAGDYSYLILTTPASPPIRGTLLLWPQWSALDAYIQAVRDILQETEVGEAQQMLGLRDYRRALAAAVKAYSDDVESVTLSHTESTVPGGSADPLPAFVLYAAGWAMAFPLANQAAHTNDPAVAAAVVSFRDIQTRRAYQGKLMMARAREEWTENGVQTGAITISDPSPHSAYQTDLVWGL